MGFLFLSAIKDEVWRQQVRQSLTNSLPRNCQMKLSFQIKSVYDFGLYFSCETMAWELQRVKSSLRGQAGSSDGEGALPCVSYLEGNG